MSGSKREAVRVGARLAVGHGPKNPWHRARLLVDPLRLTAGVGRTPATARVRFEQREVALEVPDLSGFLVLWEILEQGTYELGVDGAPRQIVDLGAHCGASAVLFALRFPSAEIVAVEANPLLFPLLERNVREFPNVRCVHGAVCASDQPVRFWEAELSWGGRIDTTGGDAPDWVVGTHTVPALPLDDLLSDDTDLLKMDIEGAEYDVLPTSTRAHRVPTIVGELHGVPGDPPTDALLDALRQSHDVRITSELHGPNITFEAALRAPSYASA